jgi:hypothetical protein
MAGPHTVEISMGSLLPASRDLALASVAPDRFASLKGTIKIILDGRTVLDAPQATYDSSAYDVTIGVNAIGGSTCGYAFTGEILSASRVPIF